MGNDGVDPANQDSVGAAGNADDPNQQPQNGVAEQNENGFRGSPPAEPQNLEGGGGGFGGPGKEPSPPPPAFNHAAAAMAAAQHQQAAAAVAAAHHAALQAAAVQHQQLQMDGNFPGPVRLKRFASFMLLYASVV